MKTLLIGEIHSDARALLEQHTQLEYVEREDFPANASKDVETIVLRTFTTLDKETIEQFPNLKYVVSCSVGLNNLDMATLKEKNIEVVFCPGTNANSVAEHTMYILLSVIRQHKPNEGFFELKNKTIGLVGFGFIGKLIAEKLSGFDANIIAYDIVEQDPEYLKKVGVTMKSFDEVLAQSDIVTLQVPLNKYTHNLMSAEQFAKMKQGASFVSISRPELIDMKTLAQRFEAKQISYVALDDCPLEFQPTFQNNRAFITPHVAAQGADSYRNMCLAPIKDFVSKLN